MNLIKKMSAACFALTALCGCLTQEAPNKIYTIVLDNGKMQRTLKIPAGYLEVKDEKLRAKEGVRVGFIYPSLEPFINQTPTENSISLYIKLISDRSRPSLSDISLDLLKKNLVNSSENNRVRYLGKKGVYEVFEDKNIKDNYTATSYFTQDKNSNLLEFRYVPELRSIASRRFAGEYSISYIFSPTLQSKQLEVDKAVTGLIESWLQK